MSWIEPVRIPANVEQADKIIGSFTARQVAILGGAGALLYAGYLTFGEHLPLVAFAALALPIAVGGFLLAVGQHDGISLDRYLLAAMRYQRSPKSLISTAEGIPATPAWISARPGPVPTLLKLPAKGVLQDGMIDLGPDGVAAVAEVSTVSFALRTPEEQEALVAVFGRWLNALSGPAQILVRAERVHLSEAIIALEEHARLLPHPALGLAAREHAAFLTDLSVRHDLLRRQILLIIREPLMRPNGRNAAAARTLRRMVEAARLLSACGLTVRQLDAGDVNTLLSVCFDPSAPPLRREGLALPDETITRREAR
ncbi:PrgI family protein [Nonomuraea sp. NBC_00507]|uniref:PrgI family protein n=1 Tax=Nonomuraea sp. NBC_00507 TaxID=2976002 RepID=UPI002E1708BB